MTKNIRSQQQGAIIQVLVIIILVIGLIVTVLMITNPNFKNFIFKSRADNPPITFKDTNGNPLPPDPQASNLPVTKERKIQVNLEAPPAPQAPQ